jgi:ABC transporter substrate binding protein (PQQ-dependent alcohol dehydrogenase system)
LRAAFRSLATAVLGASLAGLPATASRAEQEIRIGLLDHKVPPPALSDLTAAPEDEGLAGGLVAIRDNNTTGTFTGQTFTLERRSLIEGESPVDGVRELVARGVGVVLANLAAPELLAVADDLKERGVLLNVGARDDALRGADCRANVFHVAPSRAMLTDGLAQFLAARRWRNLLLVIGPKPEDKLYAEAMRRSARKFGLKIAAEKPWEFGPLARARADSPTQAEALVFTRGTAADVIIVADEADDFGDYIPYHTAEPRLVMGTQGLFATTWHAVHDAWGSAQLQSRFARSAKRPMRALDYQVWTAVRAIGEAATRAKSSDPGDLVRAMLASDFQLAAFKGVPVTFRPWDRQLRQPILLVQPAALVSVSPQAGFLHQRTPLDTLGFDQPESACRTP